ncbi:MAG TPA: UDP-N-acetylglucosamine--N-acetylmuramyl-(pentapeptide) pyrophosphoryl-undecaprenol N-acetylglucosamine transferase [Candidatus Nanoarchaeia archaeon]|nr:UDP-N-acetylglucosamine--N-acetylmuramyl-(pentapeptide) pyrophosphoryl-undecaprenol N-acetylglucosamine transferase [uncultured archaeon]
MRKIVVTGGHLTPAIATIDELKKYPEIEIIFIGRARAMEGDKTPSAESVVIPNLGIKFYAINAGRLQRTFTRYTLWALAKVPIGFLQALGILSQERPNAVLSFGSYVAAPVVLAAWVLGIPVITHEQTVKGGLANRLIARFAKKIAVAWEHSLEAFPKEKAILVGNPIRKELLNLKKKRVTRPVVYITGGNQGAHVINEMVLEILKDLLSEFEVCHQTGGSEVYKDFETLNALAGQLPQRLQNRYKVSKWFDTAETSEILSRASVVVGRSGANTVVETMALGIPAVFIPLVISGGDEQMKNAEVVEGLGAAVILPQDRLTPKRLLAAIRLVIEHHKTYRESAKKAKKALRLNAAVTLAKEVVALTTS